jgi:hypothetical protein
MDLPERCPRCGLILGTISMAGDDEDEITYAYCPCGFVFPDGIEQRLDAEAARP